MLKRLIIGFLLFIGGDALAGTQDCATSLALTGSPREQSGLLINTAKACVRQGNYDQAVTLLGEAISKDPNNATAFLDRGTAYAEKGEVKASLEDFSHAINLKPDMAEAWYSRGTLFVRLTQLETGIVDLSQ